MSEIFTERPIIAYSRPKSLRNLPVRDKLQPDSRDDEPFGETLPCGKAACKTNKMITHTQIAKSGEIIKLRCNTSCKTTNVVYIITCTKYGKQSSICQKKNKKKPIKNRYIMIQLGYIYIENASSKAFI